MQQVIIEPWLPLVAKPSRYIDHEINAARKPWQKVNFCFAYPDVYEVGISHLGLKILYSIINSMSDMMADRCYLPWLDMIDIMRREEIPLFGIESRIALEEFDLLGITLQSELTYSNIPELLDLAELPVLAKDRDEACPIVMAGGPCATNPLPLAAFIDVFFLGEAEEAIQQIAQIFLSCSGKKERLAKLADLEGCFVPSIHLDLISQGWKVKSRKFAKFSDNTLIHSPQLLSWQLATHNRCVAEIMRGCSRGCRFCHAGYFYRPVRERSAEDLRKELLTEIHETGWDEAGLLSLSSSDYTPLKQLLDGLLNSVDTDKTHISLPSLRVDALDSEVVELMRKLGREGLTIAPEAGSQRLRDIINKNLSEEQILTGVRTALELGWQKVKLYFMIGLPRETEDDIDGIIDLIGKISAIGKKRLQINVTLSPFVPKPFTPFQWAEFLPASELLRRCLRVKQAYFKNHQIKIKYHTIESSLLEAVLSRGDLQMGEVIHQAWKLGARFDGWNECFDFSIWTRAFEECDIASETYLKEKDTKSELPWDFVDTGISKGFLIEEWLKAEKAETTADCRDVCSNCGVCSVDIQTVKAPEAQMVGMIPTFIPKTSLQRQQEQQYRFRVSYSKTGILRFISHLDWMRMLFRLISKSPLETVFTQGFSPHPKVSLCPPLPLGVESECEFFDVSYIINYPKAEILAALSQSKMPDFKILDCSRITNKAALPSEEKIQICIPEKYLETIAINLEHFANEAEHIFTKSTETRSKSYDLKEIIKEARCEGNNLIIIKSLASPSLYDVLSELLKLDKPTLYSFRIIRQNWQF